jgi:hypothetical protein
MLLLNSVKFNFVQFQDLKQFFSQIEISSVNLDLFENIKESLIESKDPIVIESRWIEEPRALPQEEISKIIEILQNLCHSKTNL